MPVIALPRIRAGGMVSGTLKDLNRRLTVDVALSFIRLRHEQVGHVPSNAILVAHGISTKDLLQSKRKSQLKPLDESGVNLRSRVDQSSVAVLPLDH